MRQRKGEGSRRLKDIVEGTNSLTTIIKRSSNKEARREGEEEGE